MMSESTSLLASGQPSSTHPHGTIITSVRVYKRRWFMAVVLGLLNACNGALWISYSAISDLTAKYYSTTSVGVLSLSAVFIVVMLVLGLPAVWIMQRIRLRGSYLVAAWCNCLSGVARILSSMSFLPQSWRFPILMIGQFFGAVGQPFCLFSTTKLANLWFPTHERAKANAFTSLCNPLGVMAANFLAPAIVQSGSGDKELPADMFYFNLTIGIPTFLTALLCTLGVWSSRPPTPPTSLQVARSSPSDPNLSGDTFWQEQESSTKPASSTSNTAVINSNDIDVSSESDDDVTVIMARSSDAAMWPQLKAALKCPAFILLMLCFGTGVGVFTALSSEISLILCSRGYSDSFAGLCGALLLLVGIPGSALVGIFVDKTRLFLETLKACFCVSLLGGVVLVVAMNMYDQKALIVASVCWFSFFGLSIYAVSLELGVESTYPLPETYSSGLLLMASQAFSLIFMVLMEVIAQPLTEPDELRRASCETGDAGEAVTPKDYRWAGLTMAGLACGVCMLVTWKMHTPYLRQMAEMKASAPEPTTSMIEEASSLVTSTPDATVAPGARPHVIGSVYSVEDSS